MFKRKKQQSSPVQQNLINILLNTGSVWAKDSKGRVAMTLSCKDTDYIPKVKDAGVIKSLKGQKIQIMHNGLIVKAGSYHGDWMSHVITELKGHHEPQEEKVFYEVVKKLPAQPIMMELGSFWSYYSLWVHKEKKGACNICCEPDATNLAVGKENMKLNGFDDLIFYEVASGKNDSEIINLPMDSDPSIIKKVPIRTVDSLVQENKLKKLDLLHMDIQGHELDALAGAKEIITQKKLRFLIVSTHHYFFSKDPLTHQKCIDYIVENGGHIIASHTVLESFSGDGLIVASFDPQDKDFTIDVSVNHTDDSLFRSHEKDLAILIEHYDKLSNGFYP